MVRVIEYILLGTFCVGLLTFIIGFLRSDWRDNIVGRYMMYFMITIAALFFYLLFGRLIREFDGRYVIEILLLLALNYGAWKITWLVFSIKRGKHRKVEDENIR